MSLGYSVRGDRRPERLVDDQLPLFDLPRLTKWCPECREVLPVSCFSRARDATAAARGELRRECKNCDRLRPPFWPVAS